MAEARVGQHLAQRALELARAKARRKGADLLLAATAGGTRARLVLPGEPPSPESLSGSR